MACLRKPKSNAEQIKLPRKNDNLISRQEKILAQNWIADGLEIDFLKHKDNLYAIPKNLMYWIGLFQQEFFIKRVGIMIGKVSGKELIPHHGLALSDIISKSIGAIELTLEESIAYLRRDELKIDSDLFGWALVRYCGVNLGWVKLLAKRINNYYPMEWRIMKSPRP